MMPKASDDRDAGIERLLRLGLSTREVTEAFFREFNYHVNPFDVSRVRRENSLPTAKSGRKPGINYDAVLPPGRPPKAAKAPAPARSTQVPCSAATALLLSDLLVGMQRLGLAKVSMLADGTYILSGRMGGDGQMLNASE